jgi:ATP-dependent DNA helicase RecG
MILEYLKKWGKTKRDVIENLIMPKLSITLTDSQKKNKVTNFLSALRIEGRIINLPGYYWQLV